MQISGQVERVVETPTKFGSLFGVIVNGTRYGAGKSSQGVNAGDWVAFSAEKNEKGYWDIEKNTMKPVPAPVGATTPAPSSGAMTSPATAKAGGYVDTRQDSIVYQSSRKDALHFVQLLLDASLIDFGKLKGADKIDVVEAFVDKYTEHFINEVKANHPSQRKHEEDPKPACEVWPEDKLPF